MQNINREKLVEELMGLYQQGDSSADPGLLRQQLESTIDSALTNFTDTGNRQVTILLSDLRGFTSVSEQYTALEMVEILNRYFARMSEIIISYGGIIDKFMGDAILALFGVPEEGEYKLESALACAIEMQQAMHDLNQENSKYGFEPIYMGIGINSGEVVAGYLGSSLHSEYTVIGDQVNLASRVEAHTLRGQILLSENSYALARDYVEVGHVNEVRVKGKKGVVRMYELLSVNRPKPLQAPPRELRNSHRVEVDMPVMFQLLDGKIVMPQEYHGHIVDLSYGGMYMRSPIFIEPFRDIKMQVSLSLMSTSLSDIYAKVLRVSKLNGSFECRVEFTFVEPAAEKILKEYVDGIIEMNRGY